MHLSPALTWINTVHNKNNYQQCLTHFVLDYLSHIVLSWHVFSADNSTIETFKMHIASYVLTMGT